MKTRFTQNKVFTECCHRVLMRYYVPVSDSFLLFRPFWRLLAVIPIQKEERERAHDQEEEDPYSEASIVFDCLIKTKIWNIFRCFFPNQPKQNADILSRVSYLSYVLVAFFNVLCCTHNQLMNIVNLAFLLHEVK